MRIAVLAAALSSAAVGLALADPAAAAIKSPTNITSQELSNALRVLAADRDLQILYTTQTVANRHSAGAVGEFTVDEALTQLLSGTGLVFRYIDENTITILLRDEGASTSLSPKGRGTEGEGSASAGERSKSFWSRVHLVQANTRSPSQAEGRSEDEKEARSQQMIELEEILVTGSRLGQTGEGPAPVTIFSRDKLDELGVSTVSEVLSFLPQQPYSRWVGTEAGGAQFAEMRGLGIDTTLVLINGRRVTPSAANVGRNAFDLNTIPLSAVERVEVLSDAASAVYGADAVGGVINVILKRDIASPVMEVSYGAAEGGGEERRLSAAAGHSGGRLSASVIVDYFDRDFLLGQERDRWRNQDYTRFGSIDVRSTQAGRGNVSSLTGENLPGLNAPVAAVPAGATGTLSVADFAATAGQLNMESLDRYSSIVPAAERLSAATFLTVALTPETDLFGEFLYTDRHSETQTFPATPYGVVVPAENPYNPFGEAVLVNRLFTELGPRRTVVESEFYRETLGIRLPMGSWELEVSALASQEDASSWITNELDVLQLDAAINNTDPTQTLNLFQDGPAANPAVMNSLRAAANVYGYESDGFQGSAIGRGTLFRVPGGNVDMAIGAEWRREKMLFDDFVRISRDRNVSAAFTELRVPIVGAAQRVPGVGSLSLTLAARYDEYTDFGDTVNPQYGVVWKPTGDLTVRASYGTSFRPPSLYELFAPRTEVSGSAVDPRREGEISFPTFTTGGNANLEPIEAESLSAGLVFSPRFLEPLRLSLTYWEIKLDRRVAFFQPDIVLANEAQYPERVVREDPSPADIAAGLPGAISNIDITPINFGTLETSGVDVAASYTFNVAGGALTPSLSATWVGKYDAVKVPNTAAVDRVGVADSSGTITEWKAIGSLSWTRHWLSLTATGRFVPGYDDTSLLTQQRTGRRISSQTIMDLQGVVTFDALPAFIGGWMDGTKFTLGANNLFDKSPSYSDVLYVTGYDSSLSDLRQRFVYAKLQKSF